MAAAQNPIHRPPTAISRPPEGIPMTLLPHMAARLFGAPLMIHRPKLEVILAVLGPRIGLPQAAVPSDAIPDRVATPSGATGIAVLPVYGTLVRRTVGLEAE